MWNVKFLSEAEADMHSLDNSLNFKGYCQG